MAHAPQVQLAPPADAADERWLSLRLLLWPEASASEHREGMAAALARGHFIRLALAREGAAIGFVEAALRNDYVNGTSSSPVAFLEGLFVAAAARRQGVARARVEAVAQWARGAGCRELASDALLDNADAHAAHRRLGFEETERVVYFRRSL